MRRIGPRRAALVGQAYDLLAAAPEGLNKHQIADGLGVSVHEVTHLIRDLRLTLGSDDITVTTDPNGMRQPWIYRLVGTLGGAVRWIRNRVKDSEARIETLYAVIAPVAKVADKRTMEGRKAVLILRAVGRLREDLTDLGEHPSLF